MWLIRVGLASGPGCCVPCLNSSSKWVSTQCQGDVNNKCTRGRIKTHPTHPTVIFTVKMFWIDVCQPQPGMSARQWLLHCLLTYMSACLSLFSTSILPPCLSVSVGLWRLAFIQVLLISATSSTEEKFIFRDKWHLSQGHTHTANIYVMIVHTVSERAPGHHCALCKSLFRTDSRRAATIK